MAKLIYTAIMSLDGYIADKNGDFSWADAKAQERECALMDDLTTFLNHAALSSQVQVGGRRRW
jgi:hypothetical protein